MEQIPHHQEMTTQVLSSYPPPWVGPGAGAGAGRGLEIPSLELGLSISVKPPSSCMVVRGVKVEALKWEAAEQIRLAAMEKAYAEHVMELTRREMEMAQSEFLRARSLWERAREEVERAERMREKAASSCMERDQITCLSCSHAFTP